MRLHRIDIDLGEVQIFNPNDYRLFPSADSYPAASQDHVIQQDGNYQRLETPAAPLRGLYN